MIVGAAADAAVVAQVELGRGGDVGGGLQADDGAVTRRRRAEHGEGVARCAGEGRGDRPAGVGELVLPAEAGACRADTGRRIRAARARIRACMRTAVAAKPTEARSASPLCTKGSRLLLQTGGPRIVRDGRGLCAPVGLRQRRPFAQFRQSQAQEDEKRGCRNGRAWQREPALPDVTPPRPLDEKPRPSGTDRRAWRRR